jgi:hypothetical protein
MGLFCIRAHIHYLNILQESTPKFFYMAIGEKAVHFGLVKSLRSALNIHCLHSLPHGDDITVNLLKYYFYVILLRGRRGGVYKVRLLNINAGKPLFCMTV